MNAPDTPGHSAPVTVAGVHETLTNLLVAVGRLEERVAAQSQALRNHISEEEGDFRTIRDAFKASHEENRAAITSMQNEIKKASSAILEIHASLRTIRWIAAAVAALAGLVGAWFGQKAG